MRKLMVMVVLLSALTRVARAQDIPAVGTKLTPQQRAALTQLVESDPELRAQVYGAAKNAILEEERKAMEKGQADFFNDQQRFVIIAYGIMWALVVVFVVFLFLRQKRLEAELAEAEKRIPGRAA